MNTLAMAKAYISDARRSFEEAKQNYESQIYHRCVRRCQECVELALKGILRLFSVEYPKKHDVSEALDQIKHIPAAPDWLKSEVDRFKRISLTLALMRGPAFYGDERSFIPPEKLYGKKDALEALEMAMDVLKAAEKLLTTYTDAHQNWNDPDKVG